MATDLSLSSNTHSIPSPLSLSLSPSPSPSPSPSRSPPSPIGKLTKFTVRSRIDAFHQRQRLNQTKPFQNQSNHANATNEEFVEKALNKLISSSESYEEFVASFDSEIEPIDQFGTNRLTAKQGNQEQLAMAEGHAEDTNDQYETDEKLLSESAFPAISSSVPLSSSSATSHPSPLGSDFIVLMRMLAADKDRLKSNTSLTTGDDEEDARLNTTANSSVGLAAAFSGDHIRVDDSYGFTADPFAPESAPNRRNVNDEGDDEDEARIRIIGEDEDEDEASEQVNLSQSDDEDCGGAKRFDAISYPRYTEEEAGASLESEPVESDYKYDAEKDNLSLEQFKQKRLSAAPNPQPLLLPLANSASNSSLSSAPSLPQSDHSILPPTPPTQSARASSRLAADEEVEARPVNSTTTVPPSTDMVESFLDEVEDIVDSDEEDAIQMREVGLRQFIQANPTATQKIKATSTVTSLDSNSPSTSLLNHSGRSKTSFGLPISSQSVFTIPPRPHTQSTQSSPSTRACTSSTIPSHNSLVTINAPTRFVGLDYDVGDAPIDDVETVDLDDEVSTSVPILAQASVSQPSRVRVGNLLDARQQLGFEFDEQEEREGEDNHNNGDIDKGRSIDDPHDNDVSEEEGEWVDVEPNQTKEPTPPASYIPSISSRQHQRPRRIL